MTLGIADRTATSVQLRGEVDPNGSETHYRFEYGVDPAFPDYSEPFPSAFAGSGNAAQMVFQDISGLQPDTVYFYRIVVSNVAGSAYGQVQSFRTRAVSDGAPQASLGEREVELVSLPIKKTGHGISACRAARCSAVGRDLSRVFRWTETNGSGRFDSP